MHKYAKNVAIDPIDEEFCNEQNTGSLEDHGTYGGIWGSSGHENAEGVSLIEGRRCMVPDKDVRCRDEKKIKKCRMSTNLALVVDFSTAVDRPAMIKALKAYLQHHVLGKKLVSC